VVARDLRQPGQMNSPGVNLRHRAPSDARSRRIGFSIQDRWEVAHPRASSAGELMNARSASAIRLSSLSQLCTRARTLVGAYRYLAAGCIFAGIAVEERVRSCVVDVLANNVRARQNPAGSSGTGREPWQTVNLRRR
jgi:hypothetical protein